MSFKVVIPARHASVRLPGKPLVDIAGRPMIRYVWERALQSGAAEVLIATDDDRIAEVARGFGARVEMTAAGHGSGTERVCEAVERIREPPGAVIVNLQCDEPLMPPALLDQVAADLAAHGDADVATLRCPIREAGALFDPSVVKVVCDREGYALYFSRAPVPWHREAFAADAAALPAEPEYQRHIGVYAYRVEYLRRHVRQPPCALERAEALEQLRTLYNGGRIHVGAAAEAPGPGVDTAADLERVRGMLAHGAAATP